MRILIKERGSLVIREVTEIEMDNDKFVLFVPSQKMKYLTKDKTRDLFERILYYGFVDLSEFECSRYAREILL